MKKSRIIAGALLLTSFTVGAATGTKITAELKSQQISYNGSNVSKKVVSYDGTTYVPLREFSQLVGIPVEYKNNIIYLGEKTNKDISYWGRDLKHMAVDSFTLAEYEYNGKSVKSNVGTKYNNYLTVFSSLGEGGITFPLNGKYTKFRATFAVPEGSESGKAGVFSILVDGKNVYSKRYSPQDMPEDIEIDIKGAQKIKFSMDPQNDLAADVGLFNGEFIK